MCGIEKYCVSCCEIFMEIETGLCYTENQMIDLYFQNTKSIGKQERVRFMNLNHFDEQGNAVMVDVSGKEPTFRTAVAEGIIKVSDEILTAVTAHTVQKGDVLGVARVAGIMAVKQTSNIIPMCHPLMISKCSVDFEVLPEIHAIKAICTVKVEGKTGVEMEALHGVSAALLTIYDMCKAIDKRMVIDNIHLVEKQGGKSGDFHY